MDIHEILNYISLFASCFLMVAGIKSKDVADFLLGLSFFLMFILRFTSSAGLTHEIASFIVAACLLLSVGLKVRNKFQEKSQSAN